METIEIFISRKEAKKRVAELGYGWYEAFGLAAIVHSFRPEDELDHTEEARRAEEMGIDTKSQKFYAIYPDRVEGR
jgi:hypothetical protein